ncbi:hypothetical protein NDU88_004191 [Pleurodeles waltl]|uniref:Uncharacterized protein n=1 Tax=Pleurodeles waltl TaxID=8319 RepID=A0AAV7QHQ6_PLEWA|nr:hypothetical protein NDU88_004191 [Pleurodeles waltl]
MVLRGTISAVTTDDGRLGSAQVRLDLGQQGARVYLSGCNQAHVPEQHGLALEGQRFGRPADFAVPVEVRAPLAHRVEERAQSRAVRPTARETPVHEFESMDETSETAQEFAVVQFWISTAGGMLDAAKRVTSAGREERQPSYRGRLRIKGAVEGSQLQAGKN